MNGITNQPGARRSGGRRGLAAVAAAGTAVLVLTGCSGTGAGTPSSGAPASSAASAAPAADPANLDREFLTGMVPHHAGAVAMSQVELARGTNPRVKALAQTILSSQQREIGEMTSIAQQQYHFTPSTLWNKPMGELMGEPISMNVSQMGPMMQQVPQPQVDHQFLMMMIPHHAGAVMMANQEQKNTTNPQLKTLAQSIVASQSQEIGQIQAMLASGI